MWPRDCSDDGYATDSIFFLETCLVSQVNRSARILRKTNTAAHVWGIRTHAVAQLPTSQLCLNGVEFWGLEVGQAFECEFSKERFDELEQLLLSPYT